VIVRNRIASEIARRAGGRHRALGRRCGGNARALGAGVAGERGKTEAQGVGTTSNHARLPRKSGTRPKLSPGRDDSARPGSAPAGRSGEAVSEMVADRLCIVCDSAEQTGCARCLPIAAHVVEPGYRRDSSLLRKSPSLGRPGNVYPCRIVVIAHRKDHGIDVTLATVGKSYTSLFGVDAAGHHLDACSTQRPKLEIQSRCYVEHTHEPAGNASFVCCEQARAQSKLCRVDSEYALKAEVAPMAGGEYDAVAWRELKRDLLAGRAITDDHHTTSDDLRWVAVCGCI